MTRRICVPLTTRGNYAKMKSTMQAIAGQADLELAAVLGGPLLRPSYGDYRAILAADGIAVADEIDYLDDDTSLAGMAGAAGRCLIATRDMIVRQRPDWMMVVADRYEALAIAEAALCMNVRIAHLEGGEVSGSIDERIRHAITKLAHLHLPANSQAAERITRMGEPTDSIVTVGTPSLDLLATLDLADRSALADFLGTNGRGHSLDLAGEYVVVSHHPVVTEHGDAAAHFAMLAEAVRTLALPTVWILPNLDAGAGLAAAPVDRLIGNPDAPPVRCLGSLPMELYAVLLANGRCLIGNSSSGLREGAFLGVPTVNIGSRQAGRARGANVVDVGYDAAAVVAAARGQVAHGRYARDVLYGDGTAGQRIAAALARHWPAIDKTIMY